MLVDIGSCLQDLVSIAIYQTQRMEPSMGDCIGATQVWAELAVDIEWAHASGDPLMGGSA